MTNKELITRLLDFHLDKEVCIDKDRENPRGEIIDIGYDDDGTKIWITNYK